MTPWCPNSCTSTFSIFPPSFSLHAGALFSTLVIKWACTRPKDWGNSFLYAWEHCFSSVVMVASAGQQAEAILSWCAKLKVYYKWQWQGFNIGSLSEKKKGCEKCLPTGPRSCHCTDCATEALVFFDTQKTDGGRNTDFHVYILLTSSQLKVRFTSLSLPNSTVMNMEEKCMFLTQHQQSTTQYSVKSTVREPSSWRLLFLSAEQSHTAGMSSSMLGLVLTNIRAIITLKTLQTTWIFFFLFNKWATEASNDRGTASHCSGQPQESSLSHSSHR